MLHTSAASRDAYSLRRAVKYFFRPSQVNVTKVPKLARLGRRMSLLHTPQYSGWARGHLLCRVEDVSGRFAVTFDDGPNLDTTPALLDALAELLALCRSFFASAVDSERPEAVEFDAVGADAGDARLAGTQRRVVAEQFGVLGLDLAATGS